MRVTPGTQTSYAWPKHVVERLLEVLATDVPVGGLAAVYIELGEERLVEDASYCLIAAVVHGFGVFHQVEREVERLLAPVKLLLRLCQVQSEVL